ncbi:uncharacterized protein L969DRAFT_96978 [Mixia osmundae IAM 14324]|uniref:DUF803-domain-containing protein n=1 Tax=Mixia osmundae (strain CBS 9802 / IAM 14324 / JCM 22182 / KY 12970) TaxID=764103 RepID=G7E2N9_MIXOS|nr:uncharacterized protein L969DRAFT_96978 [Mixia osmundae IAM 14324]KEI36964.1 hypothetical protein L969DRAFT_96978 [Mixia osmundae IAM 14324]GAA97099.1 hypothetical protein E5Q_03774 [Mixia osmundae IAM 14324]
MATATSSLTPAASSAVLSSVLASASSVFASASAASAAAASATASASGNAIQPTSYKLIGVLLAVVSGVLIGSSFVFKKKGLLAAQKDANVVAGESHAYLKSPMWWTGMTLMIVGEICNFIAYAFAPAILVTPLGALSVVICAILSAIFLKERLTFFGKIGCALCIIGATIIALNGPEEQSAATILEFQHLFLSIGFLIFGSVVILACLVLIFFVAPKYGKENIFVYISICSLIGGLSVSCTQGLGSSIVTSIRGQNQFKHWFIYFLLAFVVVTLLTEINYLNKALELFNTATTTAIYYVLFTTATLVTSVILFQGLKASVTQIVTVVFGFLVICCGITLLQMSKIDPNELKLDRRSTILLSHSRVEPSADEKGLEHEEPGVDAIRGGFGAIGSIYRARSARHSIMSASSLEPRRRQQHHQRPSDACDSKELDRMNGHYDAVTRHQLWDKPMPDDAADKIRLHSPNAEPARMLPHLESNTSRPSRAQTIGFNDNVTEHRYPQQGSAGIVHSQHAHKTNSGDSAATTMRSDHRRGASQYGQSGKGQLWLGPYDQADSAQALYEDPYEMAPSDFGPRPAPSPPVFASSGTDRTPRPLPSINTDPLYQTQQHNKPRSHGIYLPRHLPRIPGLHGQEPAVASHRSQSSVAQLAAQRNSAAEDEEDELAGLVSPTRAGFPLRETELRRQTTRARRSRALLHDLSDQVYLAERRVPACRSSDRSSCRTVRRASWLTFWFAMAPLLPTTKDSDVASTAGNGSGVPGPTRGSTSYASPAGSAGSRSKTALAKARILARRILSSNQMDFELAAWQLTYLCIAPRRVYRNVYYHKQTKNTWARDDPAMLLLISLCLTTAGLLWSIFYAHYSLLMVVRTTLYMVFVDFLLVGVIVATLLWALSNRFMTHSSHTHATEQEVEWGYSFDVHCNSFFPMFLHLYLAQLVLSAVVTRDNWVCLWVGNTLYLAAFAQYIYVTYLGYNALPFLIRTELLLFPAVLLLGLYFVSLLGFNVAKWTLAAYFGV